MIRLGAKAKLKRVRAMSKKEAIPFFLKRLIAANGDAQALLSIYTEARQFEQDHTDLQAALNSKRAIREAALDRKLNLNFNQDRAIYLELFETTLLLFSIEDE